MPTHYSGTRAEMRTLDTFIKLSRCMNSLYARLAERSSIGDLTWSQFAVLEAACGAKPTCEITVEGLLEKLDVSAEMPTNLRFGNVRIVTQTASR